MPENEQKTVLIIDDTPVNVALLVDYLEDHDIRVVVAQDGEEGIKRAQFAQPDLILLDVMMPGLDGFETCRRLRADQRTTDIPVIFMTALSESSEKVTGFGVGGVDYVTKPLQIEEVLARVTTHLTLRAMQSELEQQNLLLHKEIEARQKIESALRLTQFSVDHATNAIFWLTPDGSICYVNDAACRLMLHPRAMLMTMHAYDIELGATVEHWAGQWASIKEHRSYATETNVRIRGNVSVPVEITMNYLEYGGREYAFASVRDISERKQAEKSLMDSNAELKEINTRLEEAHRQLLEAEITTSAVTHSGAEVLQVYIGKLHQLLGLYERADPLLAAQPELQQEIRHMRQALELDHAHAVSSNTTTESHLDEREVQSVDMSAAGIVHAADIDTALNSVTSKSA